MFSVLKKILPYLILGTFIYLIYNFYSKNKSDFDFIYNLNYEILFKILILCLLYLITEAIILKKITSFFNKEINIKKSFLVINTTYLCNTFVSFSGLGFRAFYLKKIFKINITDFIILSLFIILIEIFVFSFFGFCFLILADFFDHSYKISTYLKYILFGLSFMTVLIFISYNYIYNFVIIFLKIDQNEYIKKISIFFSKIKNKDLKIYLLKFIWIFLIQFILLFLIFYLGHSVLNKENSFIFSIIATSSTDLSFIFTITPYAVGISEAFIFFGSSDLDINLAEIIFLSNLFRLSIFLIYFLIGLVHLYFFLRKIKYEN